MELQRIDRSATSEETLMGNPDPTHGFIWRQSASIDNRKPPWQRYSHMRLGSAIPDLLRLVDWARNFWELQGVVNRILEGYSGALRDERIIIRDSLSHSSIMTFRRLDRNENLGGVNYGKAELLRCRVYKQQLLELLNEAYNRTRPGRWSTAEQVYVTLDFRVFTQLWWELDSYIPEDLLLEHWKIERGLFRSLDVRVVRDTFALMTLPLELRHMIFDATALRPIPSWMRRREKLFFCEEQPNWELGVGRYFSDYGRDSWGAEGNCMLLELGNENMPPSVPRSPRPKWEDPPDVASAMWSLGLRADDIPSNPRWGLSPQLDSEIWSKMAGETDAVRLDLSTGCRISCRQTRRQGRRVYGLCTRTSWEYVFMLSAMRLDWQMEQSVKRKDKHPLPTKTLILTWYEQCPDLAHHHIFAVHSVQHRKCFDRVIIRTLRSYESQITTVIKQAVEYCKDPICRETFASCRSLQFDTDSWRKACLDYLRGWSRGVNIPGFRCEYEYHRQSTCPDCTDLHTNAPPELITSFKDLPDHTLFGMTMKMGGAKLRGAPPQDIVEIEWLVSEDGAALASKDLEPQQYTRLCDEDTVSYLVDADLDADIRTFSNTAMQPDPTTMSKLEGKLRELICWRPQPETNDEEEDGGEPGTGTGGPDVQDQNQASAVTSSSMAANVEVDPNVDMESVSEAGSDTDSDMETDDHLDAYFT